VNASLDLHLWGGDLALGIEHSPISWRRPFQLLVDPSEFEPEELSLAEVTFGEFHQIIEPGALVVAAYSLMQRPPH
jgi:hypothetical protein